MDTPRHLPIDSAKADLPVPWSDGPLPFPGIDVNKQVISITFGMKAANAVSVLELMRELITHYDKRKPNPNYKAAIEALTEAIKSRDADKKPWVPFGYPNAWPDIKRWPTSPDKQFFYIAWCDGPLMDGVIVTDQTVRFDLNIARPADIIALMRDFIYVEGVGFQSYVTFDFLRAAIDALQ